MIELVERSPDTLPVSRTSRRWWPRRDRRRQHRRPLPGDAASGDEPRRRAARHGPVHPVGQACDYALTTLRLVVEAIADSDTVLAGAILESVPPEAPPDGKSATVASCIGVALDLVDNWFNGRHPDAPAGSHRRRDYLPATGSAHAPRPTSSLSPPEAEPSDPRIPSTSARQHAPALRLGTRARCSAQIRGIAHWHLHALAGEKSDPLTDRYDRPPKSGPVATTPEIRLPKPATKRR